MSTFANQSTSAFEGYSEVAADFSLYAFFIVATLVWSRLCPSCLEAVRSYLPRGKDNTHEPIEEISEEWPVKQFCDVPDCSKHSTSLDAPAAGQQIAQPTLSKAVANTIESAAEAMPDMLNDLCTWPKELEEQVPVTVSAQVADDTFNDLCTWSTELEDSPPGESQETMDIWQEPSDALYLFGNGDAMTDLWPAENVLPSYGEAASEDACKVLEAAMSSGDPELAESALAAGMRLCSAPWLAKACDGFLSAGIRIKSELLIEVMHVYSNENRADLAVDLWQAVCDSLQEELEQGQSSEEPPATDLYGAALEACARCGDFETAERAAGSADWRSPSCKFGQDALLALARWFARRQDVTRALNCYEAVRQARGYADLATHRAVLVASIRSADMAQAEELFQDFQASGLVPDGPTLSAMICGHCAAGNVEQAMSYFGQLKRRGIAPTAPLFDAMLDGCAWMNMPSLMEQVLVDMEAAGVRPSTSTLTILMRNYGSNGDTARALAVFEELPKRHGFELDGPAYGALISVCLSNGCFSVGWSAFEKMAEASCVPHARTYEALIASCLRRGYLERAVRVVDEALNLAAPPQDQAADEPLAEQAADERQEVTPRPPRARLEKKVVEEVLRMIGRRHATANLGIPLLARLQAARVEVSDALVEAMQRSSRADTEPSSEEADIAAGSVLKQRQSQFLRWRNFHA